MRDFHARALAGREVGPQQNAGNDFRQVVYEFFEPRIHFRGTAGDVRRLETPAPGESRHVAHGFPVHDLRAGRTGFEVTVAAGLVAESPDVHLQKVRHLADQHQPVSLQNGRKGFHAHEGLSHRVHTAHWQRRFRITAEGNIPKKRKQHPPADSARGATERSSPPSAAPL